MSTRLIGRVSSIDYKNKGQFNIYLEKMNKTFTANHKPYFLILNVGDKIDGLVSINNDPKAEAQITFVFPPLISIPNDRDSLIRAFHGFLNYKTEGKDKVSNFTITEILGKLHNQSDYDYAVVDKRLDKMATSYYKSRDVYFLKSLEPLTPVQAGKLLYGWYKRRVLRKLYNYSLTKNDIYSLDRLSPTQIYEHCSKFPYYLPELPMEKCDMIYGRHYFEYQQLTPVERRTADIFRTIYKYSTARGWTAVPLNNLLSQIPDFGEHCQTLISKYDVHIDKDDRKLVYLPYNYEVECYVGRYLHKLSKEAKKEWLVEFTGKTPLDSTQKSAIRGALENPVSIICGRAGSGKTTIIYQLVHNLEQRNIKYALAAFTGKAVSRIKAVITSTDDLKITSAPSTLHMMIAKPQDYPEFEYLIIDESSMLSMQLFYQFITRFTHKYSIIFIGDVNQLPPIEWGDLFRQMLNSEKIPTFRLQTVHRLKTDEAARGILTNANGIFEDNGSEEPYNFTSHDNFQILQGTLEDVKRQCLELSQGFPVITAYNTTIITPYRKCLNELNTFCQSVWHGKNQGMADSKGNIWRVGDRVMMNRNNYTAGIMNGEEGVIKGFDAEKKKCIITFGKYDIIFDLVIKSMEFGNDEGEEYSDVIDMSQVELSYVITIHKSQGSQWKYVILYIPPSDREWVNTFINKNMIYTAITRCEEGLIFVGDINTLNIGLNTRIPSRVENLLNKFTDN